MALIITRQRAAPTVPPAPALNDYSQTTPGVFDFDFDFWLSRISTYMINVAVEYQRFRSLLLALGAAQAVEVMVLLPL